MCLKAARGAWHGGYISINSNNLCLGQMLSATLKLAGRAGQSLNGYNVILPAAPHHAYNIATLCSAAVLQAAAAQSYVFGESPPPPCRYAARTATCINNSNCLTLHTDILITLLLFIFILVPLNFLGQYQICCSNWIKDFPLL